MWSFDWLMANMALPASYVSPGSVMRTNGPKATFAVWGSGPKATINDFGVTDFGDTRGFIIFDGPKATRGVLDGPEAINYKL